MKHAAPFWNASCGCGLFVKLYEDALQRRKKSLKLTDCSLTVLCEPPGGPGLAPDLFLHSLGVFLVMATASPVPACNHSSWVKSESGGNILQSYWMSCFQTTFTTGRESTHHGKSCVHQMIDL